jgi:hypothetical protein
MRANEAATLDALIGRREILGGPIAAHAGRLATSRTSRMTRVVYMWIAAAVVLLVLIGEAAAQPNETAGHPKKNRDPSFV